MQLQVQCRVRLSTVVAGGIRGISVDGQDEGAMDMHRVRPAPAIKDTCNHMKGENRTREGHGHVTSMPIEGC